MVIDENGVEYTIRALTSLCSEAPRVYDVWNSSNGRGHMPAGTAGGPNDALTAVKLMTVTVDSHLVVSSLLRCGISFAGAQQFSQGQAVTNAAERLTIAKVLSELLKQSATLR